MGQRFKKWSAILFVPQILLVKWVGQFPEIIEKYYSQGWYPKMALVFEHMFGFMPFSFGDLLILLGLLSIPRYFYRHWHTLRNTPKKLLIDAVSVVSLIYFLFHLIWGLNYYRVPLEKKLSIENTTISKEDWLEITQIFIAKANDLQLQLTADTTRAVQPKYTKRELLTMTSEGYKNLSHKKLYQGNIPQQVKKSMYSIPLSYMGTAGHLNPLTLEAQVNTEIPAYAIPYVSSHEMAHQLGYAAENEASFIGFMTAMNHPDPIFQYSAVVYITARLINRWGFEDPELYEVLVASLHVGVLKNFQESMAYNEKYKNPFEPVIQSIYGNYLKANAQHEGVHSYDRVTTMLIEHFKKNRLEL